MPVRIKDLGPCAVCNLAQWHEVHKAEKGTKVGALIAHQFESKPWTPKPR